MIEYEKILGDNKLLFEAYSHGNRLKQKTAHIKFQEEPCLKLKNLFKGQRKKRSGGICPIIPKKCLPRDALYYRKAAA